MALGYDQNLFVLAFDHRGSTHCREVFGAPAPLGPADAARIADAKSVVADGFARALAEGAPADAAGILVDEELGAEIAHKARANGWICAMPVERSGVVPLELEYGDDFPAHVEEFDPTFAKVLVRYNPEGNPGHNEHARRELQRLSTWLQGVGRSFLCELIVPAEPAQLAAVAGDERRYETELRPELMRRGMGELQGAGIDPDVWKLEGVDRVEDGEMIVAQARRDGRDRVGCVVLGAGASPDRVEHWLRTAAAVDGYRGFAVGRTLWVAPIQDYLRGALARADAAGQISASFLRAIAVFRGAS